MTEPFAMVCVFSAVCVTASGRSMDRGEKSFAACHVNRLKLPHPCSLGQGRTDDVNQKPNRLHK